MHTKIIYSGLALVACIAFTGCPPIETHRLTQGQIDNGEVLLAEVIREGRALFIKNFDVEDGFGNGKDGAAPPNFSRLVGPDSSSCMSCHGLGNDVVAGWGSNAGNVLLEFDDPANPTVSGSNERSTPAIHGLSWLELLAAEISDDIQTQRLEGLAEAAGAPVTVNLTSKGISYGSLVAMPDGTLDNTGLEGVSEDLYIRPFHAKGQVIDIRTFTRGALDRHHGIQSADVLLSMDSTRDPSTWDEDEDGVVDEMNEGELTALTIYQVTLPAPVETNAGDARVEAGAALMETFNCTLCHIPALPVEDPIWREHSSSGSSIEIDLTDRSLGLPRLIPEADGSVMVGLWGDLKRHDLGPDADEPRNQPVSNALPYRHGYHPAQTLEILMLPATATDVPREMMLTIELWGVGDTGPWWHDGSAPTIEAAILRHGGEAQEARDAFANASTADRQDLLAFLTQLRVGLIGEVLVGAGKSSGPGMTPLNSATE